MTDPTVADQIPPGGELVTDVTWESWIHRPYSDVIRTTGSGLPYVLPEIVLLFKARLARPKDEADFNGTLPLLDQASRSWLRSALERLYPGHAWVARQG